MANEEHLDLLRQGVDTWNQWRAQNPGIQPNLSEADLRGVDLNGVFFSGANLTEANLSWANFSRSMAENSSSECGSGAWDRGTEPQISCKLRSVPQAGRERIWR